MHTLLIGAPGVGKSTLIRRVVERLGLPVFGVESKKETALTDSDLGSPVYLYEAGAERCQTLENLAGYCKEGQVRVFPEAFARCAAWLRRPVPAGHIILLDELGFMEGSSGEFCEAVLSLLDGDLPVLAAVKERDTPFLQAVRGHPKGRCFQVTPDNRDGLYPEVLRFVQEQTAIK